MIGLNLLPREFDRVAFPPADDSGEGFESFLGNLAGFVAAEAAEVVLSRAAAFGQLDGMKQEIDIVVAREGRHGG